MILCLDVGNSQIFGGVFSEEKLQLSFRYSSITGSSSDQIGIFLREVLRENNISNQQIKKIAICSVVPHVDYSLTAACIKYFNIEPFMLQAGVKTGLKIKYHNPLEVGSDRIANAIAATHLYPKQDLILVDFGTATTFCAISADKDYLGGVILPGMRIAMEALQANTAKLFPVEIVKPKTILGRSTRESIQSGLYYSQLGTVHEVLKRISQEVFIQQKPLSAVSAEPLLIATGGFAQLFSEEKIFTAIIPDLVLQGLYLALNFNK